MKKIMYQPILIDDHNIYDIEEVLAESFKYMAIGKSL